MLKLVHKLMLVSELDSFRSSGIFKGNYIDNKSNFIHLSSSDESINRILEKYYKNDKPVFRVSFLEDSFDAISYKLTTPIETSFFGHYKKSTKPNATCLAYEIKYSGIYPHVYGNLEYKNVYDIIKIKKY